MRQCSDSSLTRCRIGAPLESRTTGLSPQRSRRSTGKGKQIQASARRSGPAKAPHPSPQRQPTNARRARRRFFPVRQNGFVTTPPPRRGSSERSCSASSPTALTESAGQRLPPPKAARGAPPASPAAPQPPTAKCMISSWVALATSPISPAIRPACITRMRSDMPNTSGNSELIIRIALPSEANRFIRR